MSNEGSSNGIVQELLNKDNYVKWSHIVKTYLISQALWNVVVNEDDSFDEEKNGKALHAIMLSCGPEAIWVIINCEKASEAWTALANKFTPYFHRALGDRTDRDSTSNEHDELQKALISGDWSKVAHVLERQTGPDRVTKTINNLGENSLHVAACYGHNRIIQNLIDIYLIQRNNEPPEVLRKILEQRQKAGHTVLSLAAVAGNIQMAEYLLGKNPNLHRVKSAHDKLPVLLALYAGKIDMVSYLIEKTSSEDLQQHDCFPGVEVLGLLILSKKFDIAWNLVTRCKELIISESDTTMSCPMVLAMCKSAFPSGTPLSFWQKWIYDWIDTPSYTLGQSTNGTDGTNSGTNGLNETDGTNENGGSNSVARNETRIPITDQVVNSGIYVPSSTLQQSTNGTNGTSGLNETNGTNNGTGLNRTNNGANGLNETNGTNGLLYRIGSFLPELFGLLYGIRSYLLELFGVDKMYELKLMHLKSKQFLKWTLETLRNDERRVLARDIAQQAMIKAVEEGNVEFIIALFKAIPEIIWSIDHRGRTVFSYAVECRQAEIFSLIHGFPILKHEMAPLVDDQGDNMLHMAGKLAPPSHLNHISGAALQMQRELQWFKKVESILENNAVVKDYFKNWKTKRPREYFTENHKQLAIDGEKWMKEIATSCIFVSALIVTVTFAAAFVVPGGTEAEGPRSLRALSHQNGFRIFIITDAISLFFSTTSVLMFLGILTSPYYEDAFLKLLPKKLIVGFVTLFISIAAMMIAFCSSLDMMLQGQFFILIPVVLLGAPVILFLNQQWPILVEIFVSTYGRGIFTRKYDNWMLEE